MVAEKIWHKSHHMYLPEITKTCFLGRPQKKIIRTQWLLACSTHIGTESHGTRNGECSQLGKLLSKKLKFYSNAFKSIGTTIGQICFNIFLQTWKIFFHIGLTEPHIFFVNIRTTFFSLNVFIISGLVFFLIRRNDTWVNEIHLQERSRSIIASNLFTFFIYLYNLQMFIYILMVLNSLFIT